MEQSPAISLIIPAYNSALHLKECLDSILFQDIKEPYEAIIVVDPSKDETAIMAASFALKHRQFKLIENKERQGIAKSRLIGIEAAKAPYISFMDADDILGHDALTRYVKDMKETQADIINYSFWLLDGSDRMHIYPFGSIKNRMLKRKKAIAAFMNDSEMRGFLWTKVFKRSLFDGTNSISLFDHKDMFEDVALVFSIVRKANGCYMSKDRHYYYRKGVKTSASTVTRTDRAMRHLMVFALMREHLEKNDDFEGLKIYRRKYYRIKGSLFFDLLLDRKYGANREYIKSVRSAMRKLKKKEKLPVSGEVWEESFARAL